MHPTPTTEQSSLNFSNFDVADIAACVIRGRDANSRNIGYCSVYVVRGGAMRRAGVVNLLRPSSLSPPHLYPEDSNINSTLAQSNASDFQIYSMLP
jgi:hypothetical protein